MNYRIDTFARKAEIFWENESEYNFLMDFILDSAITHKSKNYDISLNSAFPSYYNNNITIKQSNSTAETLL